MKIKSIIHQLEAVAPSVYQESYDNAGLIVGNANKECTGVITCLDSTEAVIDEAIAKKCNLVVAHHPIVFKGLKRFTGKNYVERVILKAIKNDIAVYAIHTNLDNVYSNGVNTRIANRLGLTACKILAPKATLKNIVLHVDLANYEQLRKSLLEIGINTQSSPPSLINTHLSTKPEGDSAAAVMTIQATFSASQEGKILQILSAYEQLDYSIQPVLNKNKMIGSGMVGVLEKSMNEKDFLAHIKQTMNVGCIKYTPLLNRKVKKVAICGGSGGFLLRNAIASGADFFITSDYKYHEFFDADGKIVIADIGHFESEQFTINLLSEIIREKFGNFAVHCTAVNTNPVQYYT